MHCGKHVVSGIPTWLFGMTENLKMIGKTKGVKDPKSFKQKTSTYPVTTWLQSLVATPCPKPKRNVAYKTVFVKQITSQGYVWKVAQWC